MGPCHTIASNVAMYVTVKTFVAALRVVVVQELEPRLLDRGRPLSQTPRFPSTQPDPWGA